jgi:CBS domain-containing protein
MNPPISTLLEQKGAAVRTVPSSMTVAQAVREMNHFKIGAVLVVDGARIVGIFTERDVLTRVVAMELDPKSMPVTAAMTPQPMTVPPETTVQTVMEIFTEKHFRHLPVVKDGRLFGVISIGDVTRWVANAHRLEAEHLRQYVHGGLST